MMSVRTSPYLINARQKGFGIKFQFNGPRKPQGNVEVERKFQSFNGRIRALLNGEEIKG
jgi:hypothetical protein